MHCGFESKNPYRLVGSHAYTLLGVAEAKVGGATQKLVKVRNPWGSERYNGPWSDKDTKVWTPEVIKQLNHTNKNDGSFYVPLDIFCKYHSDFGIVYYKEWIKTQFFDQSSQMEISYFFTNPVDQEFAYSFDQIKWRQIPSNDQCEK